MKTERFPPAFVNRERELEIMKSAMERAREGKGSTILITGDVGVGKTRLAEKFVEICEDEGFVVLSSLCLGSNEPAYFPVLTVLENYAKKVREHTEEYVPLGLAGFQGLEVEERTPAGLAKERTRILEYLLRQFVEIARKQPVLFVIDDLHLADSATLAFFHYLARNVQSERIVVVATHVEEHASTDSIFAKTLRNMNIEKLYTLLMLENFGEKETVAVVEHFGFANSTEIGKYIYERTSGNPLFVIEFLEVIKEDRIQNIETIKRMGLPATVKNLIELRVSKLDERTRRVLVEIAILGKVCEYEVMKKFVDLSEGELLDAMDELMAQNFIIELGDGEEYKFVSSTVYDVVYGKLTSSRKRLMHQKAGKIIEELHASEEKYWGALARHYREAGNREKFIEYGIKAGRAAARRFANAEAIGLLNEVVEAIGNTPEEMNLKGEVYLDLAEVLELEGRYNDALEILERRIEVTLDRPAEIGKNHIKRAEIYICKGDYESALIEIEKGEKKLLEDSNAELEQAMAWSTKGLVYERKGEYRKAIESEVKASNVFERLKAEKENGKAIHRMGTCYWYLGDYEKALELLTVAQAIREKTKDLRGLASTYNNIGVICNDKGDYEKALAYHTKSLELREKIGDVWGIALSYNNIGVIYQDQGDYEEALAYHRKSLKLKEKIGDLWGTAMSYNNIGIIYQHMGENEKAMEYHLKSLEINEKIGDVWSAVFSSDYIGDCYFQQGEYGKALELYTKALQLASEIGDRSLVCQNLIRIGECRLISGDIKACEKHLDEAKEIVRTLGLKDIEGAFLRVLGKLLVVDGKGEEGIETLSKAVEIYESIGKLDVDYHKTLFELGKLRRDKALLERALAFFEKIGNRVWAERVREEMGKLQ
ncbi:MAG: tetratricopeptide repeat protein [Thermoplasmata archaeon]